MPQKQTFKAVIQNARPAGVQNAGNAEKRDEKQVKSRQKDVFAAEFGCILI